ncbi:hypothetical protein MBLNU230_g4881t1 [Neophaeotheca triangularis]
MPTREEWVWASPVQNEDGRWVRCGLELLITVTFTNNWAVNTSVEVVREMKIFLDTNTEAEQGPQQTDPPTRPKPNGAAKNQKEPATTEDIDQVGFFVNEDDEEEAMEVKMETASDQGDNGRKLIFGF